MNKISGIKVNGVEFESVLVQANGILTMPTEADISCKMKKIGIKEEKYQKHNIRVRACAVITFTFDPPTIEGLNRHLSRKKFKTMAELDECINTWLDKNQPNYIEIEREV